MFSGLNFKKASDQNETSATVTPAQEYSDLVVPFLKSMKLEPYPNNKGAFQADFKFNESEYGYLLEWLRKLKVADARLDEIFSSHWGPYTDEHATDSSPSILNKVQFYRGKIKEGKKKGFKDLFEKSLPAVVSIEENILAMQKFLRKRHASRLAEVEEEKNTKNLDKLAKLAAQALSKVTPTSPREEKKDGNKEDTIRTISCVSLSNELSVVYNEEYQGYQYVESQLSNIKNRLTEKNNENNDLIKELKVELLGDFLSLVQENIIGDLTDSLNSALDRLKAAHGKVFFDSGLEKQWQFELGFPIVEPTETEKRIFAVSDWAKVLRHIKYTEALLRSPELQAINDSMCALWKLEAEIDEIDEINRDATKSVNINSNSSLLQRATIINDKLKIIAQEREKIQATKKVAQKAEEKKVEEEKRVVLGVEVQT